MSSFDLHTSNEINAELLISLSPFERVILSEKHGAKLHRAFIFYGLYCLPVWSILYSPCKMISETGIILYPSARRPSITPGKAAGVFFAALWNSTIRPGPTLFNTRSLI